MQCAEGRQRDARRTDLQAGAIDGVKLPSRQDRHSARRQLHVHDITGHPPLALNTTHALPIQRMPPIMDYDFLPDMGRMTARLPSEENHGSSLAPSVAPTAPPSWPP
jgi:hypothetical protein